MKKILLFLLAIFAVICCIKLNFNSDKNYKKITVKINNNLSITENICNAFMDGCDCIIQEFPDPNDIKQLVESLVNVNEKNAMGRSALHCVPGMDEYQDIIKLLISKGADVNIQDEQGSTPIFNASEDKVKLLIAAGADVNIKNKYGQTLLDKAIDNKMRKLLIKHGAKSGKDLK